MIFPKKVLVIALVIIVAGGAAYFFFIHSKEEGRVKSKNPSETASEQTQRPEETALPVKAVPARRRDLVMRLRSPGEVVTERIISVKAEVPSIIKKLYVKEGKHVGIGDLLLELEDEEYRLKLEKQEALRLKYLSELLLEKQFAEPERPLDGAALERLNNAREAFEKASRLYDKGMIARNEFEKAQRDYELVLIETGRKKEEVMASSKGLTQAEIDVQIARMELEKTRVKAPFSGIITDIKVSLRENIERGRELFTLVNISEIKVQAKVLESEVGKMKVGREVDIKFSAYPEKIFKGAVESISPLINPDDKTCKVYVAVSNPNEEIKPGMHAEVEIAADIYKDRLLIPQEAVLVRAGRKLAFVVDGGLAKWRYLEIGLENVEFAEVLDGLKEGDLVIVEGHFTLAHDAKVRVLE